MWDADKDGLLDLVHSDFKFLSKVGMHPCRLDDPCSKHSSGEEPKVREAPSFTEHDDQWLSSCGVTWEPEPEPGFQPPASSLDYLAMYPERIRAAVEETAESLKMNFPAGYSAHDLLREVISVFVEGPRQSQDLAEMYGTSRPPTPGTCKSAHFHEFVRFIVEGIVSTLYPPRFPHPDSDKGWR